MYTIINVCPHCGKIDNEPLCSQCRQCGTYLTESDNQLSDRLNLPVVLDSLVTLILHIYRFSSRTVRKCGFFNSSRSPYNDPFFKSTNKLIVRVDRTVPPFRIAAKMEETTWKQFRSYLDEMGRRTVDHI